MISERCSIFGQAKSVYCSVRVASVGQEMATIRNWGAIRSRPKPNGGTAMFRFASTKFWKKIALNAEALGINLFWQYSEHGKSAGKIAW